MTPAQLLVYGSAPGAEFEGRLVGAIERRGRGEGSLVAPLLGFRLDPGERRRMSEKALRTGGTPLASELVDAAGLGELSADLIAVAARGEKRG
jgi:hypothetical protein